MYHIAHEQACIYRIYRITAYLGTNFFNMYAFFAVNSTVHFKLYFGF